MLGTEALAAGPLADAMRYAALGGGKRMRPLLAYAAGECVGADPDVVDAPAAAVELIHAYSLVHDDLPCMDDDVLRRGRPTTHVAFGEAMALLAGDALQALAFGVLAGSGMPDPGRACLLLADAAGSHGMAGGQAIDLAVTGSSLALGELTTMHRLKTGALIDAAVRLGALSRGALAVDVERALAGYAAAAGLAFQVVDDVLDVEGTAESLGKTAGKDAAQGKPTFVTLMGLAAARAHAEALRLDAHAALAPLGAAGARLGELADWITRRSH
ncbi:MAG: polyprenyl synthetase family protein [Proteobacteria bacterium]|nr:polyprenyl synthetase family protein [Pseudomonadota bacterium]